METRLSNQEKSVVISPEAPFTIIGERINPTRRKKLAETMAQGDFSVAAGGCPQTNGSRCAYP